MGLLETHRLGDGVVVDARLASMGLPRTFSWWSVCGLVSPVDLDSPRLGSHAGAFQVAW